MFQIIENIFIKKDKLISEHITIDDAIEKFNNLMSKYELVLHISEIEEFEEYKGYRILELIHHKYGLIKLGIREV